MTPKIETKQTNFYNYVPTSEKLINLEIIF